MKLADLQAFQHVNWNPDRKELRSFAVAMLVGFAILGLIAAAKARGFGTPTFVLWTAGIVLAMASQVPGMGRGAYRAVYVPSSLIGFVVSQVLLTLIFVVVFIPIGFVLRLTGKDPLYLRPGKRLHWFKHAASTERRRYYRQY
jgi:hypothetical protein